MKRILRTILAVIAGVLYLSAWRCGSYGPMYGWWADNWEGYLLITDAVGEWEDKAGGQYGCTAYISLAPEGTGENFITVNCDDFDSEALLMDMSFYPSEEDRFGEDVKYGFYGEMFGISTDTYPEDNQYAVFLTKIIDTETTDVIKIVGAMEQGDESVSFELYLIRKGQNWEDAVNIKDFFSDLFKNESADHSDEGYYNLICDGLLVSDRYSYKEGEKVEVWCDVLPTDGTMRFYIDGMSVKEFGGDEQGLTVIFTMPDHDVTVTSEFVSDMTYGE